MYVHFSVHAMPAPAIYFKFKENRFSNHIYNLPNIWIARPKLRQMINMKAVTQSSCHCLSIRFLVVYLHTLKVYYLYLYLHFSVYALPSWMILNLLTNVSIIWWLHIFNPLVTVLLISESPRPHLCSKLALFNMSWQVLKVLLFCF